MRGDWSEHGQLGKYKAGCRCGECRAANARRAARGVQSRRDRAAAGDPAVPHGSYAGYREWCCRCEGCTAANTAAIRKYRASRLAAGKAAAP